MSNEELENQLLAAMRKLEEATDKLIKTSGYNTDAKKMRLLMELIKEQIKNENSLHSTNTVR